MINLIDNVCKLAAWQRSLFFLFLVCPGRGAREGEAAAGGFAPGAGRAEGQIGADAD